MEQPTKTSALVDFFAELRRRRVVRVVIVYAIAGWVVIEVASTMLPGLNLPAWPVTFVIALVVLGFPLAVIIDRKNGVTGRNESERVDLGGRRIIKKKNKNIPVQQR